MKKRFAIALLSIAPLFAFAGKSLADTLTTENYRITITAHCEEGNVTCHDVSYLGVDRNTGASIRLTGQTVSSLCADGVTPCRFQGYEFHNGEYFYFVSVEGNLIVRRDDQVLLNEAGEWHYSR